MWLLWAGLLLLKGFEGYAQIGPPPVIVLQPLDQTVLQGGTAIFSVVAVSVTKLRYQWRFNGEDIQSPDADRSTYTIANVTSAHAGNYSVRVKNNSGAVRSSEATLTVINSSLRFDSGQKTNDGIQFQITGPIASDYVILASTDLVNWTPISTNAALAGNVVFTDTATANYSARYYRAMLRGSPVILEHNVSGGDKIQIKLGRKGAQSFRHGTAGDPSFTINRIVLRLSREAQLPDADPTFSVGTGINSDAVAGSSVTIAPSTITDTSGGNSFQPYEIVYATPVGPLAAGTTYYLNLECEAANGRSIYCESTGDDIYSNGTYYDRNDDNGQDLWFQIWGQ